MTIINWQQRATELTYRVQNFIDGKYIDVLGLHAGAEHNDHPQTIKKFSCSHGRLLYTFKDSSRADVDRAVASAKQAFEDGRWRAMSVAKRKTVLYKLADLIDANKEEFALFESLDVGKPIHLALTEDLPGAVEAIRASAEGADKLHTDFGPDASECFYQLRRPIGVVAGIIGWNYPLSLAAQKVGPVLAMGNSLVLKPSEFTSLSACRLAQLAVQAGVPAGVFNVVHGTGVSVGTCLASHADVDLLTFTGSSATGKQIMLAAGQSNMKKLILECGGKSPYLVFDDCPDDLDRIAKDIVARAFANQGALCIASTRLLIHENLKESLLPKILQQVAKIDPQDPLESGTRFGAIMNEAHMNKVLGYIDSGVQEGARLIFGGKRIHNETGGFFIEPTIFDGVDPQQKIAQEEIFGPVLCIFTFKNEEEAIALANNSVFGLAAFAATQNIARVKRLGQYLNVGLLKIIGSNTFDEGDVAMNIEPHKQSGFGTEGGLAGLSAYTKSTGVHILS